MNRLILALSFLFVFSINVSSQVLTDAVRYSLLDVGGTARSVGIGGAIGALGADFSVLSTNPAGAAAFRRSEFTFTPTLELSSVDATLRDNNTNTDNKTNFNFNNIGVVFSGSPLSSKWRTAVFGIGVNRMANFHQNIYYEGSTFGSITDRWWELAGTTPDGQLDQFEAQVALDAGALYDYDPQLGYLTDFLDDAELPGSFLVDKSQQIKRKGSINELVFTYAGNYDEKLMIGATLGVPILNYEETKTFRETDDSDRVPFFDELEFTEKLKTKGSGINFKLGLIYRLSQMVRLGAAIHTPTSFGLEDTFSTDLSYRYEDGNGIQRLEASSPEGTFEYRMRTPWRFIGSGGVIIQKQGFLSAELEYVDYTNAKLNFNSTSDPGDKAREEEVNGEINTQLKSALNIRFGGEYALESYRLRAGYSLMASPYADIEETNGSLSLGAGYRGEGFFIDLAYKRLTSNSEYRPYLLSESNIDIEQQIDIKDIRNRFMLTLGFKL
jgi:long-subunit fatty acid transport protein